MGGPLRTHFRGRSCKPDLGRILPALCPSEVSRGRFLGSEGPGVTPAGPPTKIILDVNPNRSEDVQEKVRLADKKTPCFGRQKTPCFGTPVLEKSMEPEMVATMIGLMKDVSFECRHRRTKYTIRCLSCHLRDQPSRCVAAVVSHGVHVSILAIARKHCTKLQCLTWKRCFRPNSRVYHELRKFMNAQRLS